MQTKATWKDKIRRMMREMGLEEDWRNRKTDDNR